MGAMKPSDNTNLAVGVIYDFTEPVLHDISITPLVTKKQTFFYLLFHQIAWLLFEIFNEFFLGFFFIFPKDPEKFGGIMLCIYEVRHVFKNQLSLQHYRETRILLLAIYGLIN